MTEPPCAKPAIACENVWQVFGVHARARLAEALAQNGGRDDQGADAARFLHEAGLVTAVRDATLSIAKGELFVIMGLSGSGKSTLIRCIARLIDVTGGTIYLDGEDILNANKQRMIALRRQKLGMVFQHFGLFPHMSVIENVDFPLKMQGVRRTERRERALEVITLVGLEGREHAFPRELSGGQRQRVGIARSLAANPDIWLLDEPFSALDSLIRRQLQDEFLDLQKRLKKSIMFITHDMSEALRLADRIAIMRDGAIVQIGTPADIVLKPCDSYVREFSRDVAKGRHACVDSVMRRDTDLTIGSDDPGLRPDMTLDAALAACIACYRPVPVHDPDGKTIGVVDPRDLVVALQSGDS